MPYSGLSGLCVCVGRVHLLAAGAPLDQSVEDVVACPGWSSLGATAASCRRPTGEMTRFRVYAMTWRIGTTVPCKYLVVVRMASFLKIFIWCRLKSGSCYLLCR